MKSVQTSTLLKLTLWLDAAVCAALAVLQLLTQLKQLLVQQLT